MDRRQGQPVEQRGGVTPERETPRSDTAVPDLTGESHSPEQRAALADPTKQEAYRKAYLEQLRRQNCPGCGDDGVSGF